MSFIAFPIRLNDGFVERTDEVQAILTVIRIMATTPHRSWAGCPHFGMRDFFEQARTRPELPDLAIQEANLALTDLGITGFVIESITKEQPANPDVASYNVTVISAQGERVALAVGA